jgi:2-C-methyl-D-erythritol 2,4-cyclodiphosphate synthase
MFRIGIGNDVHRLVTGRPLILGGVRIESDKGAEGHSDADALVHAITDALLGALALGDIGSHFSDKDPQWKGADSLQFLVHAVRLIKEKNYRVVNVDSIIMLERPKLRPHVDAMRENLARVLEIDVSCVSVKAKTGEGIDAVGQGEAVRAEAIILLERNYSASVGNKRLSCENTSERF